MQRSLFIRTESGDTNGSRSGQDSSRLPLPVGVFALFAVSTIWPLWPLLIAPMTQAWDWVPTDQEIQRYRKSWNPLSNGPIFLSGVDIHPQGQFTVHPFIFSQISEKRFGNQLTDHRTAASVYSYQVAPVVTMAYGLTNHLELNMGLSGSAFWATARISSTGGRVAPGPSTPGSATHRSISSIARSCRTTMVGALP